MVQAHSVGFTSGHRKHVLQTGQTTRYAANDDGALQTGTVRSYSNNQNYVVVDNITGLMWQDVGLAEQPDWNAANTLCENLVLNNFGDWRMPSIEELMSISDYGAYDPALPGLFREQISRRFWSSTPALSQSNNYWAVHFGVGLQMALARNFSDTNGARPYVRCVRGPALPSSNFVRDDTTGVVSDLATGLEWQDQYYADTNFIAPTASWQEAINYCQGLEGGSSGWHLPNYNELMTIVDLSVANPPSLVPAINPVFQNHTHGNLAPYHSSTSYAGSPETHSLQVDVVSGNFSTLSKNISTSYVLCVRGSGS
jgi:hypothetical protein